ncbi:MAG: glycosyltransferase family 4 protein [Candidatus Sulfotelmatobacter sp.]|jgi:glycosyltransferase involved in cell wall biosynthesis
MKIAQVSPLYESVPPLLYGGTERVVSWLTEELVRMGHDVTLFASGDSVTTARLVPLSPRALRLDSQCKDPIARHVLMMEQVFSESANFDLIHSHVDYLHFSLSRRTATPCLSTLHGRLDIPDLVPLYQAFREMPLVSISDAQRKPLSWANWQGTVHHGMPRKSLRLMNGSGGYLAFLGRISPEKGVDEAIEIARRAGVPLKIAAKIDPADREYFENYIKPLLNSEFVEFVGEIGYNEKNAFLGNAAGLLFPICWPEPFGLVMIEALACGTPVIGYRHGSVPEVLVDGVTGFIVPDSAGAVDAVKRLSQIDRKVCRNYFDLHFSDERMALEYMAIYEKLIHAEPSTLTIEDGVLSWTDLLPNSTT